MKKTVSIIMSLLMVMLVFSCELTTPTVSDSGTIPYQRPNTPSNVKVESGNTDKIVITWDPVPNASYYVIEGAVSSDFGEVFSVFGNTSGTTFSLDRGSEIRTDRSYLFTVRAVTKFSNGTTFVSLNSEYVEGALAPAPKDIQFYSVVTSDTVTSYWNVPTLFSTLHGSKTLYDADFALGYKLASDPAAPWTEIRNPEIDGQPWMFHQVSINESALKQNEEYFFRVGMDIKDASGNVKNTVYSNSVKLMLHSDKLPSPIKEITVKDNGTSLDGITLEWIVPEWTLPLATDNIFFRIERKEVGTEEWVKLVDETRSGEQSSRIVRTMDEGTGIISVSFKDDGISANDEAPSDESILRDKEFIYRITNAAAEGKVIFVQDKAPCESPEASMFWTHADNMGIVWTSDSENHNADVTASWTFTHSPEGTGLVPVLVSETKAEGGEEWTLLDEREYTNGNKFRQEYGEGIVNKSFRYSLELRIGDAGGECYADLGEFPVAGYDGTYPTLITDKIPSAVTYESITAGTSVNGITIKWNIPEWKLPLSDDNIFFKIERKDVAGSEWKTLVDEIAYMEQDSRITRSVSGEPLTGTATFTDDDFPAIRDKKFVYRITNASFHNDILYVQHSDFAESSEGYVFEPEIEPGSIKMTWTEDSVQASASMHLSWKFLNAPEAVGLVPVIVTESLMPENGVAWKNEGVRAAIESMNQDFGDGISKKSFRYIFQLRKGSTDGEIYETYGYIPVEGMAEGQYPTISVQASNEPSIEGITASRDRVGRIALQFKALRDNLKYSYGIDGVEAFTTADARSLGGDLYEITVEVADLNEHPIVLRAQDGKLLYSAPAVTGNALKTPADLNLSSKVMGGNSVAISWNPSSAVADIEYTAVYREKGESAWREVSVVDFPTGTISFETPELLAGEYEYGLRMQNAKHKAEGTALTDIFAFDILPEVTGITASKGSSKNSIIVSWEPVDKATGYEVWRYTDDIAAKTRAGNTSGTSYTDNAAPAEARYTVVAVKGKDTGRLQTEFGTVKNPLLDDEEANLGYKFGTASFDPVSESYLTADNHLKDYFTVSFKPDRSIPVYTLSATAEDISYEFDLGSFTLSGTVRTNGKSAEEVGYAEYDPSNNTFKANVRFGILNEKLAVSDVAVTGKNGSLVSEKKVVSGDTLRAPGATDYAVLFNEELRIMIGSAHKAFSEDWYGSIGGILGWKGSRQVYKGTGFEIANVEDSSGLNNPSEGWIKFSSYEGACWGLDSVSTIKLMSTNGGGAGYLGADPLNVIGNNASENKTKAVISVKNTVNGKAVVYDDVFIRVNGITKYPGDDTSKANWQGGYVIKIGSGAEVNIPIMDLKVKPY